MSLYDAQHQLLGLDDEQREIMGVFWQAAHTMRAELWPETHNLIMKFIWGRYWPPVNDDSEEFVDDVAREMADLVTRTTKLLIAGAGTTALAMRVHENDPAPHLPPLFKFEVETFAYTQDGEPIGDPSTLSEEVATEYWEHITAAKLVAAAMNWDGDQEFEICREHLLVHGPSSLMSVTADLLRLFLRVDGDKLLAGTE